MKVILLLLILQTSFAFNESWRDPLNWPIFRSPNDQCVIVLHGLFKDKEHMVPVETHLFAQGFFVVNSEYPSKEADIDTLADKYIPPAIKKCEMIAPSKIHFVAHSMGSILVRSYFSRNETPKGSRVVMLAPPNQGGPLVDIALELKEDWAKSFLGPAGIQLAVKNGYIQKLKPMKAEVGIIAGKFSMDPWWSYLMDGDDDGKVPVEMTKLAEMKDFIIVDSSHKHLMKRDFVLEEISYFLLNGKFKHHQ